MVSRENLLLGFPTRFHKNQAVQPQKMARALKFQISEEEGLYYLCSKNKGTDQLRSEGAGHVADLHLWGHTGLVGRASDSRSGDTDSINGRVGVLFP